MHCVVLKRKVPFLRLAFLIDNNMVGSKSTSSIAVARILIINLEKSFEALKRASAGCTTLYWTLQSMSCRPILRDLRCRNDIVCRSCLAGRAKQPVQAWWAASYSSQASRTVSRTRLRPQSQSRPNADITRQPTQAELAGYLEGLKRLQTSEKKQSNEDDFSVRFFEQGDRSRKELSSEHAFEESLSGTETAELRDNLLNLGRGLRNPEERDAFGEVLKEMGGDWGKARSADDVEKLIAKLEVYARSIDDRIKEESTNLPRGVLEQLVGDVPKLSLEEGTSSGGHRNSIPQVLINPDEITTNRRRKLTKFNSILSRFALAEKESGLKPKAVQSLYKAYHSTRLALAQNWSDVPPALWQVLWRAFSSSKTAPIAYHVLPFWPEI